jgi:hypothetical protein
MGMKQKKRKRKRKNQKNSFKNFFKMAGSKNLNFSTPPILNIFLQKFHGFILGLVRLNDAKFIDVAQPIWPFFESAILNFYFEFYFFFYFIPIKISHKLWVRMDGTQLLLSRWFTAKK